MYNSKIYICNLLVAKVAREVTRNGECLGSEMYDVQKSTWLIAAQVSMA